MKTKETQAGRLRGPGAAGGADPGTPNTTAAEKADDAVVSTDGAAAGPVAPTSHDQSDAQPLMTGNPPPEGGGVAALEGDLLPGAEKVAPDWLGIAEAGERASIAGTVEQFAGEPGQGAPIASYVTSLRVASRSPSGFRRCGRRWGPQAVEVPSDEFSDDEILQLFAEPELIVLAVTGGLPPDAE